ncbi:MAG: MutS-related protein [Candidatus Acidiferrales bacterium]
MAVERTRVPDPRSEYSSRIDRYARIVSSKEILHRRIGNWKLATIAAGIALAWLSLGKNLFSAYWMLAAVAAYIVLAILHGQVIRSRAFAEIAAAYYRRGIARVEDRWAGTGESGDRFRDPKHNYSDDLDLFGRGCLFELLSTARLPMGEDRLAQWLRDPSPVATVIERQSLIAELRGNLGLRESLAITGTSLRARLNPESLLRWSEGTLILPVGPLRATAALLAIAATAALVYYLATLAYWPLVAVLIVETFVYRWLNERAKTVVSGISCNADGLVLFSQILERLEKEPFTSHRLQEFAVGLKPGGQAASHSIRQLARIVYWIDARNSLIGKFLDLPLLYTLQAALAAESWRRLRGKRLRSWLDMVGEIEALLSLSSYSFEHPQDPFPEFVEAPDSQSLLDAEELGHPLIPAGQCVRNSVRLDARTRLLLVSGSNMSGKSTFLRTIGINVVLARAGAPIRGKSLRLSPLALGTRIRSVDSLQEGRSNFYTEILRIRQVFDLTANEPLLFLFDELLEGTNSNDRRIGADGLLRALLERGAVGVITTHDLALTEISHSLGGLARNAHFQDYVEDGKIRFDYKLADGVVARSNALELMRLIGLKV